MNKKKMEKKALDVLSCKKENLKIYKIPDHKAVYFQNTIRGGGAVIISEDESMLLVNPFYVSYEDHLNKFLAGERNLVPSTENNKLYKITFILLIVYMILCLSNYLINNYLVVNYDILIDIFLQVSRKILLPIFAIIISVLSLVNVVKKVKIVNNIIFISISLLLLILINFMPLFISEKRSEEDMIADTNNLIAKIKGEEPKAYFFKDLLMLDPTLAEKGYTDNSYITYFSENGIKVCLSNGEKIVDYSNEEISIRTIGSFLVSDCGTTNIMSSYLTSNYIESKHNIELIDLTGIDPLFGGGNNRTSKEYNAQTEDGYFKIYVRIIDDELVYEDNYLEKIKTSEEEYTN